MYNKSTIFKHTGWYYYSLNPSRVNIQTVEYGIKLQLLNPVEIKDVLNACRTVSITVVLDGGWILTEFKL